MELWLLFSMMIRWKPKGSTWNQNNGRQNNGCLLLEGKPVSNLYENIGTYIKMITRYERITVEREKELSYIIQHSQDAIEVEKAKEEMTTANLRLVISCAKRFLRRYHGSLAFIDLIAEGNIGLLKAVEKYDPDHESQAVFSTYAAQAINFKIKQAIRLDRIIRIPSEHNKYRMAIGELEELYGENITDEIIMAELGLSETSLENIRTGMVSGKVVSLEEVSDNRDWQDVIGDGDDQDDDNGNKVCSNSLMKYLRQHLDVLNDRQRIVMEELHFKSFPSTYRELAQRFGISHERIRQIYFRSLKILKGRIIKDWNKSHKKKIHDPPSFMSISHLKYRDPERFRDIVLAECERQKEEATEIINHFLEVR